MRFPDRYHRELKAVQLLSVLGKSWRETNVVVQKLLTCSENATLEHVVEIRVATMPALTKGSGTNDALQGLSIIIMQRYSR